MVKLVVLFITTHLENQLVWVDTIRQAKGRAQVPFHLRYFLDEGQKLSINSFLVLLPLLCQLVLLFLCVKDLSLLVTGPPQLLLLEVGVVKSFGDLHARDVDFGVGGDDKFLVSPAQGDSVQGKRASDEQETT